MASSPSPRSNGQKSYELTAAGREELGAWWEAVPVDDPPPRDELMLKMLMAIEHGPEHALDVITRHRTALSPCSNFVAARNATTLPAEGRRQPRLVADALVVRAEADLRWLDLCESRPHSAAPKRTPMTTPILEFVDAVKSFSRGETEVYALRVST